MQLITWFYSAQKLLGSIVLKIW